MPGSRISLIIQDQHISLHPPYKNICLNHGSTKVGTIKKPKTLHLLLQTQPHATAAHASACSQARSCQNMTHPTRQAQRQHRELLCLKSSTGPKSTKSNQNQVLQVLFSYLFRTSHIFHWACHGYFKFKRHH